MIFIKGIEELNVVWNVVMIRSSSLGFFYDDVFGGFLMGVSLFNNDFGDLLGGFKILGFRLLFS